MHFRRIFQEKAFDVKAHVLPLSAFTLFADRATRDIAPQHRDAVLRQAEACLGASYPPLVASDYMMFKRCGNRSVYEKKCFVRRRDLLALATAEHVEGEGRFADAIADLLWAILEETSWVIPAHNPAREGKPMSLPYAFRESADYIDLFSATTAADLAITYHLVRDTLDRVCPLLCERLLYELDRRILRPFLNAEQLQRMWWAGLEGQRVNNWNPWITSNVLTVCALTEGDTARREAVVAKALDLLDNFTVTYHDDGGCEEGPSYWGAAGGALFDACCLLYDMTGGYVDVFDDPLIRRMGEYKPTVYVHGCRFLNFADSPARLSLSPALLLDWGTRCHSEPMLSAGRFGLDGAPPSVEPTHFHPYRYLRSLTLRPEPKEAYRAPRHAYLEGLGIAISRESTRTDEGLYLAFKGGHNGESHNHTDVGTFTVFADGRPLFVDAGAGSYTKRTFSPERYTIWSMRTDYHNLPTVNNCVQKVGRDATACHYKYEKETGKLSMELTKAYPEEAGLSCYTREAVLADGAVTVTDTLAFSSAGTVDFHLLCVEEPTAVGTGELTLGGHTVCFDPSLTVTVEPCDHTLPETAGIAGAWDVPTLFRITLHTPSPIKKGTFRLTVR